MRSAARVCYYVRIVAGYCGFGLVSASSLDRVVDDSHLAEIGTCAGLSISTLSFLSILN